MPADGRLRPTRRKISLACEPCQERKSRCDGTKPVCLACQRRGIPLEQCIYTAENARSASIDSYIKVLHDRIRQLEQTCLQNNIPILTFTSVFDASRSQSYLPATPPSTSGESILEAPGQHAHVNPGIDTSTSVSTGPADLAASSFRLFQISHENVEDFDQSSPVSAMGTFLVENNIGATLDATQEFYGDSSAASFLQDACASIDERLPQSNPALGRNGPHKSRPNRGADTLPSTSRGGHQTFTTDLDRFCLPPRAVADELLQAFWDRVFHFYPIFHRPAFEQAYDAIWKGEVGAGGAQDYSERIGLGSLCDAATSAAVFYSALNVILALGCLFSKVPSKAATSMSKVFFRRCKQFLDLEFLETNSIAAVQTLLLITLFLQSTNLPKQCWNSVGIACRIAQSLGLHTESPSSAHKHSPLELEIRRMTWHGCVALDVLVSMTFGRPTMTTRMTQPPFPSRTVTLSNRYKNGLEAHEAPDTGFFQEHVKLCWVLGEMMDRVYHSSRNWDHTRQSSEPVQHRNQLANTVLDIDAKLCQWENSIKQPLSWKYPVDLIALPESRRLIISSQRTVLKHRLLYSRILLFRPVLLQFCFKGWSAMAPQSHDSALGGILNTDCARLCIRTSMELINGVHAVSQTRSTGAWWWDGLYTYTSGIILILSQLNVSLLDYDHEDRFQRCWRECQSILIGLEDLNESFADSLKHLRSIYSNVCYIKSQRQSVMSRNMSPGRNEDAANDVHMSSATPTRNSHMPTSEVLEELIFNPEPQVDSLFDGSLGAYQGWPISEISH